MEKITEHLYLIGSSEISHSYDCMVYLILTDCGCFMIDAGAGLSVELLDTNIKYLGFYEGPKAVFLTHCHIDHVGGAHYFKEKYNSKIFAGSIAAEAIEGKKQHLVAADWYGVEYNPVFVDEKIKNEGIIKEICLEIEALKIPGHTPGSLAFYIELDNEKIIFAQDVHGPFIAEWGSDKEKWQKSMQKVLNKKASILCEGHYGVYYGDNIQKFINSQIKRIM